QLMSCCRALRRQARSTRVADRLQAHVNLIQICQQADCAERNAWARDSRRLALRPPAGLHVSGLREPLAARATDTLVDVLAIAQKLPKNDAATYHDAYSPNPVLSFPGVGPSSTRG